MNQFDHKTFCTVPWSTIEIGTFGEYKICQFSGNNSSADKKEDFLKQYTMCLDENDQVMTVFTHTIEQAINSKYSKEIRISQSKGQRHEHCASCWIRDDALAKSNQPGRSPRVYKSFVQLKNEDGSIHLENVNQHITEDGSLNELPISLDLRFSNKCNMKCIMCTPYYSDMWYEDWIKISGRDNFKSGTNLIKIKQENGKYKADVSETPWHESEKWFEQLQLIKNRLRHIYITGGEPFVNKGHERLLDTLIEEGVSKNIRLEYDTNLSVINSRILDKLKQFKYVELSVSVDDVYERYEHIRFPGNFLTLLENLVTIRKVHNIQIRNISTCIGIYSVFSPIRICETFKNNFIINIRFLTGPHDFDPRYIPKHLKKEIISKYKESKIPENYKSLMIHFFENNMETNSDEVCLDYIYKFISYMNKLDDIRGTNWKKTFPDISDLLKEYLPCQ